MKSNGINLQNAIQGSVKANLAALADMATISGGALNNFVSIGVSAAKENAIVSRDVLSEVIANPLGHKASLNGYYDVMAKSSAEMSDAAKMLQTDIDGVSAKHVASVAEANGVLMEKFGELTPDGLGSVQEDAKAAFQGSMDLAKGAFEDLKSAAASAWSRK